MTDSDFENNILAIWVNYFNCDRLDFDQPGTTLFELEEQRDSNWLYLWHIRKRSFIRFGPQLRRQVEGLLEAHPNDTALSASEAITHWGSDKAALKYVVDLCYLQSQNFKPAQVQHKTGLRGR